MLLETLSVSGALLVKVSGSEAHEAGRLEAKASALMDVSLRHNLVGRWFQMMMKFLEELGPALVYAFGGWFVINGDLALGTVVAFVALLRRLYSPASDLATVHVDVVTSYAYFDRIFSVLDLEPAIQDAPDAKALTDVQGAIGFERVSFAYGSDGVTLEGIDLDVAPGPVRRAGRPVGRGQEHAGRAGLAALRSVRGQGHRRRPRRPRAPARIAALAHRGGHPGDLPVPRDDPRQPALQPRRTPPSRTSRPRRGPRRSTT